MHTCPLCGYDFAIKDGHQCTALVNRGAAPLSTADLPAIYEGCAAAVLRMLDARSKLKPEEPPGVTEERAVHVLTEMGLEVSPLTKSQVIQIIKIWWRAWQAGQSKEG